jgi:hypothetical protein
LEDQLESEFQGEYDDMNKSGQKLLFIYFIFNLLKKNTISVKLLIISRRGGHVERVKPYYDSKRMTLASYPQIFIENALRVQWESPF